MVIEITHVHVLMDSCSKGVEMQWEVAGKILQSLSSDKTLRCISKNAYMNLIYIWKRILLP